jgi:hypothetical protein
MVEDMLLPLYKEEASVRGDQLLAKAILKFKSLMM